MEGRMKQTEMYHLSQWEPGDRILREDFNSDNGKIEAAMRGFGNCGIVYGSYTGTGESSHTLTFSGRPLLVLIQTAKDKPGRCVLLHGCEQCFSTTEVTGPADAAPTTTFLVTWSGNSVTMQMVYANSQNALMNQQYRIYQYVAFLAADEANNA